MPSQCMVLQEIVQAVPVICYVSITLLLEECLFITPSQCMVLQEMVQAVLVVCYASITVLQIIGLYWVLEVMSIQTITQWIGEDTIKL